MTSVSLKYRRIDGVSVDGALVTSGLVEVVPAYRRDTGTGQMTTIGDTYPVGATIVLAPGTYLFKLRASDGKGGRVKDEGMYRLVPASGTFDVDDLAEVTPSASSMTISDVQTLIDAAMAGIAPGPGGTPTGTGPGGLFYSVDVKDTSAVGRSVMTAANAAAVRTAIGAGTSNLAVGTTAGTAAEGDDLVALAGTVTSLASTVGGKASQASVDAAATAAAGAQSTADSKVSASSPTITGTADFVNIDVSGTVVIPDASITVAKLSNLTSALTTMGVIPKIRAINATTWPAGTRTALRDAIAPGYTGELEWDSTKFQDAVPPPVAIDDDTWELLDPTP